MKYTNTQLSWLVILRVAIGWHFLYEGLVKLMNPNWSSVGFLLDSRGCLESFFHSLTTSPNTVNIIDQLNIWGLILIGLGLILGFLARPACIFGIALLATYYLSHPPFSGLRYAVPSEGSYLIYTYRLELFYDKDELFVFPSSLYIGIDRFIFKK